MAMTLSMPKGNPDLQVVAATSAPGAARKSLAAVVAALTPGENGVRTAWLWSALLVCLAAAVVSAFLALHSNGQGARATEALGQVQAQAHRIAFASQRAAAGDTGAFAAIDKARQQAQPAATLLANQGGAAHADAAARWSVLDKHVSSLLAEREPVAAAANTARMLNERTPALHDAAEQVAASMASAGAGAAETAAVQRLAQLPQRIAYNASRLLAAERGDSEAASALKADTDAIEDLLRRLLEGGQSTRLTPQRGTEVRRQLAALRESFSSYDGGVTTLLKLTPRLTAAKTAAAATASDAAAIADAVDRALSGQLERGTARPVLLGLATLFALAALGSLAAIAQRLRAGTAQGQGGGEGAPRSMQAALRQLEGEVSGLAERNLSVQASADAPFIGAIAGSVNFAVEELRRLVGQIIDAADQVNLSGALAGQLSALLADAHGRGRAVEQVTGAITRTAAGVERLSQRAEELAVAGNPTIDRISEMGEVARQAIERIGGLFKQMDDNARRAQRIAEHSRGIGEIAERIDDFAQHAKLLALNAAIQRARGVEAGGISDVLADELQGLADLSAEVTKQISALVRTLHNDVVGLTSSAEFAASQIRLVEYAEHALARRTEGVERLRGLIDGMLEETRAQHNALRALTERNVDALRLNESTAQSAQYSAELSNELAQLGEDLRRAVAGFKLP